MKTLHYIIALVALCACGTPLRIYTDYDPDYDQWHYASYVLRKHTTDSTGNLDSVYEQVLRSSVTNELEKRGYTVNNQYPSFLLRYYILVDDHTVISPAVAGYFLGPYWMRTRTHKYIDKEETIILDMVDANSMHVVWKGWVTTTFHSQNTQRKLTRILKKSVSEMLKDFPRASGRPVIEEPMVNK